MRFALNSEGMATDCDKAQWELRTALKIIMDRMKMARTAWSIQCHAQKLDDLEQIFAPDTIFR